ncbi:uncharacterized protein LOC110951913 [Acanthochromis polyacanthus]|uniref:uncharacterized protein LOC110951913 n=1 Tax=Acanthochromis polyacanthus TaxID=80966 RepID=UPI002233F01F|nr:uncharacterized protein LOC110951913 [Acanthochromis polyacanthus]
MRVLCLVLLFHASLQLQCDKGDIRAHIGGEFILICTYDTNQFLYSKKYWCRGDSRNTCEILVDSKSAAKTKNTHRTQIIDARTRGLFVKVTNLQFDDSGVYWVGIDKIYADIMTSVSVVVTQVPVSKPRLWPLSSLADRSTCWGKSVTVRCGSEGGTGIQYAWYLKDILLYQSSDLSLHCSLVEKDSEYYCVASNDINSEKSDLVSVQVLLSADSSCIYVVKIQGQPIYDCADRMSTTTVQPTPLSTCQPIKTVHSATRNLTLPINQTDHNPFFRRTWCGLPLWYSLLRWSSFASLLIILSAVLQCIKTRHRKRVKRRKKVRFRQHRHLAQRR